MITERQPLLDLSLAELTELLASWGEPAYRARQIAQWVLPEGATDFESMTNLPRPLRERLAARFSLTLPPVIARTEADDGSTCKMLFDLGAGTAVEAVQMAYDPEAIGRSGSARNTVSLTFSRSRI